MVLSPAKKLDYDTSVRTSLHSQPVFPDQVRALVYTLKTSSAEDLARLMRLSEALSRLNAQRYADWVPQPDQQHARQAVLAFNGDVYEGLQAATLSDGQLCWAQQRLAILSGLYGVLRPLDLIQPHRLEMGTRLATEQGRTLYDFWGTQIAQELNRRLDALSGERVLVNLASQEYFKSVDRQALDARVVECVFQDEGKGGYKVISFYAKRARGLMARFAIDQGIEQPEHLQAFDVGGYAYVAQDSGPDRWVFQRPVSRRQG